MTIRSRRIPFLPLAALSVVTMMAVATPAHAGALMTWTEYDPTHTLIVNSGTMSNSCLGALDPGQFTSCTFSATSTSFSLVGAFGGSNTNGFSSSFHESATVTSTDGNPGILELYIQLNNNVALGTTPSPLPYSLNLSGGFSTPSDPGNFISTHVEYFSLTGVDFFPDQSIVSNGSHTNFESGIVSDVSPNGMVWMNTVDFHFASGIRTGDAEDIPLDASVGATAPEPGTLFSAGGILILLASIRRRKARA